MRADGLLDDDDLADAPPPPERRTDRRKAGPPKGGRDGSGSRGISADALEDLADSFEERPGDPTLSPLFSDPDRSP